AVLAGVLAGCPIYDDKEGHTSMGSGVGGGTSCYGASCTPGQCTQPSDCPNVNQTCGADGQCHTGDCTIWNCPSGYDCIINSDATATCQPTGAGGGGGGGGSNAVWCGNPKDCSSGTTCAPDDTCTAGDCASVGCIYGYHCDATSDSCLSDDPNACGAD